MELDTSKMSDRWRSMRKAKRVDRLDEENDRLRTELRMTKSQLERERDRQQDVLDALKTRPSGRRRSPREASRRRAAARGRGREPYIFRDEGRSRAVRADPRMGLVDDGPAVGSSAQGRHVVAGDRPEAEPADGERDPGPANGWPRRAVLAPPDRNVRRAPGAPAKRAPFGAGVRTTPTLVLHAGRPVSDAFRRRRRDERRPRRAPAR